MSIDPCALLSLRVPQVEVPDRPASLESGLKKPRQRSLPGHIDGKFLRGPIPLAWLSPACKLSGKVIAIALAIWFQAGLRNRSVDLKLTNQIIGRFHVDRHAKSRALKALENAGLIRVKRQRGKNPVVDILQQDRNAA
jgi:hypothetical protein